MIYDILISSHPFNSAFPQMLSDLEELPTVNLGDSQLRIEMDELTPFNEEIAVKELRESPENRENGLKELRVLLKQGEFGLKVTRGASDCSFIVVCCLLISKSSQNYSLEQKHENSERNDEQHKICCLCLQPCIRTTEFTLEIASKDRVSSS